MCGIHGFITTKKRIVNADDFIMSGFIAGSLRGTDASGIVSVSTSSMEIAMQKLPIPGYMFMQDNYARTLARAAGAIGTMTICHTRSATAGKAGLNEAHPFMISEGGRELVGVHNGTLNTWYSIQNEKKLHTDSEWGLQEIFDKGKDAFKDIKGSYCFAFYDSWNPTVLNFAINSERPMHFVFTEDDSMAYASEPGMLYWLCERHRIKMTSEVMSLIPNSWYEFDVNNLKAYTREALEAPKPIVSAHTHRETMMTKAAALAARIAKEEGEDASLPVQALTLVPKDSDGLPPTKDQPRTVVKKQEVERAKDAGLMSQRGTFAPYMYDEATETVYGTFHHQGRELAAMIRSGRDLTFTKSDLWLCTCIGVADDGSEMTVVLGWPTKKIPVAA